MDGAPRVAFQSKLDSLPRPTHPSAAPFPAHPTHSLYPPHSLPESWRSPCRSSTGAATTGPIRRALATHPTPSAAGMSASVSGPDHSAKLKQVKPEYVSKVVGDLSTRPLDRVSEGAVQASAPAHPELGSEAVVAGMQSAGVPSELGRVSAKQGALTPATRGHPEVAKELVGGSQGDKMRSRGSAVSDDAKFQRIQSSSRSNSTTPGLFLRTVLTSTSVESRPSSARRVDRANQSRKREGEAAEGDQKRSKGYEEYKEIIEISDRIADGEYIRGRLRTPSRRDGYIDGARGKPDIKIACEIDRNRAFGGDLVAVEIVNGVGNWKKQDAS
ncbi:hypothetical protein M427DRAFT_29305 [Gonapodya prolifera JEL478]|uniref:Uncharacterized protein n=1 Tax=Gonapodya prolifera (strain JEL478) TaxID=1344416 RepID=A0A139AQ07_GONPJ|nr:hypothetical protein M427DRAFT_29305 [Gonapodya prolifera JEL478]|eukprot:KXS18837.1 hypothetical protein M427DRAFT_29305 [Gonapodya prolifera JEL478]